MMKMEIKYLISGFSDEICPRIEDQVRATKVLGLSYISLRGIDKGRGVLSLSDDEVDDRIIPLLKKEKIGISSIGSPIGKALVTDDEEIAKHREGIKRMCALAKKTGAKYMRIFSFYIPYGEDSAKYKNKVIDEVGYFARVCLNEGITPILENEKGLYGDTPERCLDIVNEIEGLKLAFDFANFAQCGCDALDAYGLLKELVAYVHIKDYSKALGKNVVCGMGDGRIAEILKDLSISGYKGFLTLEPHLVCFDSFSSLEREEDSKDRGWVMDDGYQAYKTQLGTLCSILDEIGWRVFK